MPYAVIDLSNSGNSADIIPARTGYRVQVLGYTFQTSGTVVVKFTDTDNAEIIPELSNVDTSGVSAHNPNGLFESPVSKGVRINLSAGVQVTGHITYRYKYAV